MIGGICRVGDTILGVSASTVVGKIWLWCKLVPVDKRLLQYKGIHQGKRCFLVGTAPSLELDDIELLRRHNEYTFSCNSIISIYNWTTWRPTYFLVIDSYFYNTHREQINELSGSTFFYGQIHIPVFGREGIAIKS